MVHQFIGSEVARRNFELKSIAAESSLEIEGVTNRSLRKQLNQLQQSVRDNQWQLQEQLANTTMYTE